MKRIIKFVFVAMMLQVKAPTWENVVSVCGKNYLSCLGQVRLFFHGGAKALLRPGNFWMIVRRELEGDVAQDAINKEFMMKNLEEFICGVGMDIWNGDQSFVFRNGHLEITVNSITGNEAMKLCLIDFKVTRNFATLYCSLQFDFDPIMQSLDNSYRSMVESFTDRRAVDCSSSRSLVGSNRVWKFEGSSYADCSSKLVEKLMSFHFPYFIIGCNFFCASQENTNKMEVRFSQAVTQKELMLFTYKMSLVRMVISEQLDVLSLEGRVNLKSRNGDYSSFSTSECSVFKTLMSVFDCRVEGCTIIIFVGLH